MNGNDEGNRIYVTYLCLEVDGVHVRILLKIISQKKKKTNTFLPILITSCILRIVSFFVILIHQAPKFHLFFAATPQKKRRRFLAPFQIWSKKNDGDKDFASTTKTGETWDDFAQWVLLHLLEPQWGPPPLEAIFPNVPWGIFYLHFTYLRFI